MVAHVSALWTFLGVRVRASAWLAGAPSRSSVFMRSGTCLLHQKASLHPRMRGAEKMQDRPRRRGALERDRTILPLRADDDRIAWRVETRRTGVDPRDRRGTRRRPFGVHAMRFRNGTADAAIFDLRDR